MTTSIERFKQLISAATNTADLIAAETALAERQAELDSLNAQLKYLSDQVEMSVIYLSLLPNDSFSAIKPIGFIAGIEKGFVALLNALANNFNSGLCHPLDYFYLGNSSGIQNSFQN